MKRNRLWQGLVVLSSLCVAFLLMLGQVPIASAAATRPFYIECSTTTSHVLSDGGWTYLDQSGDAVDPVLWAQVDARDGAYCGSIRASANFQVNTNVHCHIQADIWYANSWYDIFQEVMPTIPDCNAGTKPYTYYTGWQAQNTTVPYIGAANLAGFGNDKLTAWKCADGTQYAKDGNGHLYCPY